VYKLPQASEMIADPHNFLLEIWAAAGTPGIVLIGFLMGAAVLDLRNQLAATAHRPFADVGALGTNAIWGGAIAGLLMAMPLALLVGYPLDPIEKSLPMLAVVWLLGIPLFAAALWIAKDWIANGYLPLAATVIPQVVLLINLLAAGALAFPGV